MVHRGVIRDTKEQREIYSYGMELQIYYIIHGILLITIGFLFGRSLEVILLLFLFGMLQSNGGGYHANTHKRCLMIMIFGVLLFLVLLPIYQNHIPLQIVSVITGSSTVMFLTPVSHANHPLDTLKSKKMGRRAKFIVSGLTILWFVLLHFDAWLLGQSVVSITIAFSGVSILSAWLKKFLSTAQKIPE